MNEAEFASSQGVARSTARFYAEIGLLRPQIVGDVMSFTPADEVRMQIIQKGKRLGFALSEIKELIASHEH